MAKIIVNDGDGDSEFALSDQGATIGRVAKHCDIVIKVPEASRQHCRLKMEGSSWFVEDLGSSNGTRVNGRKVTTFELQDGDEIMVGKACLRFLESDVVVDEISLDDDEEMELEISLEEDAFLRFLNTDRQGQKVDFAGRMTFGRRSSNSVSLDEKGVSGSHTEFIPEDGIWICRDLGSTNGTFVNGEPAVEARLEPGDRVRIGTVEFVFGVGEDEGDAEMASTVIMTEVPLEDEIFAISEANMKRKQKAATFLWLGLIVAVGGAGGWWLTQGSTRSASVKKIATIEGNQLGVDGTFEPRDLDDDYLVTGSDAVDFVETSKRKSSGEMGLEVKVTDSDGDHYLSFTHEIEHISTADRIEVGGKIRTSGVSGGAVGFSLIWKDANERVLGYSHANAPMGEGKFVEVRGMFMPPYGTDHAAVAIGFHDAQGKAYVDDVFALRSRGGGATLTAHGHDLLLDASGALVVSRDGTEILDHGGFYQVDGKTPRFLGRLFAAESVESSDQGRSVSGYLSYGAGGNASFSLGLEANGVVWQGMSSGGADVKLGFAVDVGEGLVTVGAEGALRHNEDFSRGGVTELVVATGPRALRFIFVEPTAIEMITKDRRSIVLLPLRPGAEGGVAFDHKIQLSFTEELSQVNALSEKARSADNVQKRYGAAMVYYREIVNRFSFQKSASDSASLRLSELVKRAERAKERLTKAVDDVLFFRTFDASYEPLNEELLGLVSSFSGSEYEEQFAAIQKRLDDAWKESQGSRRLALAKNHLERGQDLMEPGASTPVLARGFFLSVIELAPESELAEKAKAELKKIETLLGSK